MSNAMGERTRFSTPSTSHHKQRPLVVIHRPALGVVEACQKAHEQNVRARKQEAIRRSIKWDEWQSEQPTNSTSPTPPIRSQKPEEIADKKAFKLMFVMISIRSADASRQTLNQKRNTQKFRHNGPKTGHKNPQYSISKYQQGCLLSQH
jgi:hypothetical protein